MTVEAELNGDRDNRAADAAVVSSPDNSAVAELATVSLVGFSVQARLQRQIDSAR